MDRKIGDAAAIRDAIRSWIACGGLSQQAQERLQNEAAARGLIVTDAVSRSAPKPELITQHELALIRCMEQELRAALVSVADWSRVVPLSLAPSGPIWAPSAPNL